ncbi:LEF-9 [Macrobrachium rosenbergii nudivirus]|nr:LEF-9 [Macrobrachium rosenbergii nudivirus]
MANKRKGPSPPATEEKSYDEDIMKQYKFTNNQKSKRFKTDILSLNTPLFPTLTYCIKNASTDNTLTVGIEEMYNIISTQEKTGKVPSLFAFYMCIRHGISETPYMNCEFCKEFKDFDSIYILETKYYMFPLPPPTWYSPKVYNFLRTLIEYAYGFWHSNTSETAARKELEHYAKFIKMDFNEGTLYSLSTGKTSYVRNKILGFHTIGIRATLTIDATLTPQYVKLPQKIFDNLNLATNLVILNRSPSIANTCIYVVEIIRNTDPLDATININPYITEGLHADQDGDELNISYLKHQDKEQPTLDLKMAITELKKMSWNGFVNHDFAYKPKYQFTQYHKYLLHQYDSYFNKISKLWRTIEGTPSKKCNIMMELGCSTHKKEVNQFIYQLSNFTQHLKTQVPRFKSILNGKDEIRDVMLSGAKGEQLHIDTYLSQLYTLKNEKERVNKMVESFNNLVNSGTKMSIKGAYQFLMLEVVNPLNMLKGNVYYNDTLLLPNLINSTMFSSYMYNSKACNQLFRELSSCDIKISEKQVLEYLNKL